MNGKALSRIKRKNEAFQIFKQTKDGKDYLANVKARNQAKTEFRKAVRDYEREVAKQAKRNPKAFYKFVNSKLKTRTTTADLKTDGGEYVSCDKDKAEMFNKFFSSVYTQVDL